MTRPPVTTSADLQAQLDAMERSGSGVAGNKAIGGTVTIDAGTHNFASQVQPTSGHDICGQRAETLIRWDKSEPLFNLSTFAGNGSASGIVIRDMQIETTGGPAIGTDKVGGGDRYPVKTIKGLLLENLVIRGGGIDLSGEHYWVILRNVIVYDPKGQALRLDGFTNRLEGFHVFGNDAGPQSSRSKPVVELHGSTSGYCWLEGKFNRPLLSLNDLSLNNYSHAGNFNLGASHLEAHAPGPQLAMTKSMLAIDNFAGTVEAGAKLDATSILRVTTMHDRAAVTGGTVYVNGKAEPLA